MTKAARILNEYHIKELILKGNPQYENFYKEELIEFCKISKHEIDRLNNIINELEELLKQMLLDTKKPTMLNNFEKNTIRLTIEHIQNKLKELKKGSE